MGFLKKLFGGGGEKKYVDKTGIYFYVKTDRGAFVKVRADKQHDLNRTEYGYSWQKTIVDSKYFSRLNAQVYFDSQYNVTGSELSGGEFITQEAYEAGIAAAQSAAEDDVEDEQTS